MDIKDSISSEPADSYSIIYADPPWQYRRTIGNGVLKRKSNQDIYKTMSFEEIKNLGTDIKRISRDNCALLMWATMPNLPQAFEVMEAWGFK